MSGVCIKCDRGKPRKPTQMLDVRGREAKAAVTKWTASLIPAQRRGAASAPR
ncbi:hypothetical protein ABIF68_004046 [Bradyrhizobium japonicum]|nr:hypothetical protein [Bradyrhizobium japonicum]